MTCGAIAVAVQRKADGPFAFGPSHRLSAQGAVFVGELTTLPYVTALAVDVGSRTAATAVAASSSASGTRTVRDERRTEERTRTGPIASPPIGCHPSVSELPHSG